MHTPMPLGKGEPMRITTGLFVDDCLKVPRKRLLKKSPSSKIGSTTILKNSWTTSRPESFFLLANLNLKFKSLSFAILGYNSFYCCFLTLNQVNTRCDILDSHTDVSAKSKVRELWFKEFLVLCQALLCLKYMGR